MYRLAVKNVVSAVRSSAAPKVAIRAASQLVSSFEASVNSLPQREAVRYTKTNMKWTAEEFKAYADAHANALLEHNFNKGDTIGLWLSNTTHAEKHITLIAAAKLGLKVVEFTNCNDIKSLRSQLLLSSCKALIFDMNSDTIDNLLLLRKSIPEFFHYDNSK